MPRLSIDVSKDLNARLDKFLPWGTKQNIVLAILEQLCDSVETHGNGLVGLIMSREFNLITKEVQNKKEVNKDGTA